MLSTNKPFPQKNKRNKMFWIKSLWYLNVRGLDLSLYLKWRWNKDMLNANSITKQIQKIFIFFTLIDIRSIFN